MAPPTATEEREDTDPGPEPPEEPTAAHDAEPKGNGGKPLDALTDDGAEPEQEALPIPGDHSTIGKLIPRGVPIEHKVSMRSASVRADGILDPDRERVLIVPVLPHHYEPYPVREAGVTKRWKLVQSVRPLEVLTVEQGRNLVISELLEEFAAKGDAGSDVVVALEELRHQLAVYEEHAAD